MMQRWRSGKVLAFLFPLVVAAQQKGPDASWLNNEGIKRALVGWCIMDVPTGSVVSSQNAEKLMAPASTLKLLTTAVALKELGPHFTFTTELSWTGTLKGGVLNGDIIITGGGDPSLGSFQFKDNDPMPRWVEKIRAAGIQTITGRIIGDDAAWKPIIPDQWIWADISNYFGSVPHALNYADNKFFISLNSGSRGSLVKIVATRPQIEGHPYDLSCEVKAEGKGDEAYVYGDPFGYKRVIRGTIPPDRQNYEIEAALPDPALLCAQTLRDALIKAGIKCKVECTSRTEKPQTEVTHRIMVHNSVPLHNILFITNMQSNNFFCETLLRMLGNGDPARGIKRVKDFWTKNGLENNDCIMSDGSGLSRANAVTARYMSGVARHILLDSTLEKHLQPTLPVAGKSGGMASIGKGSAIEGTLRAKTGYIERVRAYCGVVKTQSGRLLSFSIMVNNYTCTPSEVRNMLEKWMVSLGDL